jgi:hypothetical protein
MVSSDLTREGIYVHLEVRHMCISSSFSSPAPALSLPQPYAVCAGRRVPRLANDALCASFGTTNAREINLGSDLIVTSRQKKKCQRFACKALRCRNGNGHLRATLVEFTVWRFRNQYIANQTAAPRSLTTLLKAAPNFLSFWCRKLHSGIVGDPTQLAVKQWLIEKVIHSVD